MAGNAWAVVGVPDAPEPALANVNVTVWPEPMADSVFPSASVTVMVVNEAVVPRPKPVRGQVKKQGKVTGAGLIWVKASRVAVPFFGRDRRKRKIAGRPVGHSQGRGVRCNQGDRDGHVSDWPRVGLGSVVTAPDGLALAPPQVSVWGAGVGRIEDAVAECIDRDVEGGACGLFGPSQRSRR